MPGAGSEPARPQWAGDFKCLATTSRYISVQLATTKTSRTKPIFLQRDVMGCDGCVTYLSLEHPPGEGVGPVHSQEVPLPFTRDEIGTQALSRRTLKSPSNPASKNKSIAGIPGTGAAHFEGSLG